MAGNFRKGRLSVSCWGLMLSLSSCTAAEREAAQTSATEVDDVSVLAKIVLEQVQASAIQDNVEYCGYITQAPDGELKVAGPQKGGTFGCRTPLVYKPDKIIASFHNHGAFDPRVLTEIPSTLDFDAVKKIDRVDAFIGTPGGRLWHLDFEQGRARLVCGPENCLPQQTSPSVPTDDINPPPELSRADVENIEKRANKSNQR
ncbi:DUF4329 domain-containing protein [Mesorhizobium sp.]|uniref:DUF4329 domain-containing protein n=1 Tax=Mesorhizobium sp. TaxID=1871066 RepID=UPI00257B3078|nr:DUF4329 domain-containing protein [Mesorhizobium sp.]